MIDLPGRAALLSERLVPGPPELRCFAVGSRSQSCHNSSSTLRCRFRRAHIGGARPMSLDEHLTCLPSERMHRGGFGLITGCAERIGAID